MRRVVISDDGNVTVQKWTGVGAQPQPRLIDLTPIAYNRLLHRLSGHEHYRSDERGEDIYIYRPPRPTQEREGFTFKRRTPDGVTYTLVRCHQTNTRVKIWYGDRLTGEAWNGHADDCRPDEVCYIGRSTGSQKIPLAIPNARSTGGGAILDDCIIRIDYANRREGGTLYRHPQFHFPD